MEKRLQWGIIGAGRIAGVFAKGVAHSKLGQMLAVGSRSQAKADKFGAEFNVPRRYGSYEALLADPDVQAVYIATPHPEHAAWCIRAAEAGKHILCEKPITLNHAEAMAVVEAAQVHDVFLMEAFMYRCSPQTAKLVELVKSGQIGQVRVIHASFSFHAGFNAEARLFANALGGGGILDVGCYATSMARLLAGAAQGKDFLDPVEVKGMAHLGQTGVDEWAVACLKFPGDILATVATGVSVNQDNALQVFGTEGNIAVPSAWIPSREAGSTKILLHKKGQPAPEEITIQTDEWLYGLEADTVAANLERRQAPSPAMSWDDTLGNMRTLDQWRQSAGFLYESEKPDKVLHTVHRRPLAVKSPVRIPSARIKGLDKPVSRLVMGMDYQNFQPHAAVMCDDFFEKGGNCFDTAFIYGGGNSERTLGQWIKNRGVRKQVVILGKGAHTPFCTPAYITEQLLGSLERLQTDRIDIYMMHRDNLKVPVGEFIDVLNQHVAAGRIGVFGGSNWSLDRVEEANNYATAHNLRGFSALSNNFALARMVEAPWAGCLASSDSASRAWLTKTQMPLMPWSSQASGFFAGQASPENRSNAFVVRSWYCEDNFRRLERVKELAARYKVPTVAISLAYVLCQPFPTFPLIGPRVLSETRTSLLALDVKLSPDELAWLNLEK